MVLSGLKTAPWSAWRVAGVNPERTPLAGCAGRVDAGRPTCHGAEGFKPERTMKWVPRQVPRRIPDGASYHSMPGSRVPVLSMWMGRWPPMPGHPCNPAGAAFLRAWFVWCAGTPVAFPLSDAPALSFSVWYAKGPVSPVGKTGPVPLPSCRQCCGLVLSMSMNRLRVSPLPLPPSRSLSIQS